MRLVRFDNRQEVYACRECAVETLLLDCHHCERRLVRRLPDSEQGIARWACYRCRVTKHKCPSCGAGWVLANAAQGRDGEGLSCEHCDGHWLSESEIGAPQ